MAGSEKDTAVRLVLADDVGGGGGGEDSVLANDELRDAVRRTNLQNGLDGLGGEVTAIATNDKCLALGVDRVEDGLNEVLGVVLRSSAMRSRAMRRDCVRTSCWKTFTLSTNQYIAS